MPRFGYRDTQAAFAAWWDLEDNAPTVEYVDYVYPIRWLVGQLWNNTDAVPGQVTEAIKEARYPSPLPGSIADALTYAQAARLTRDHLIDNELWEQYPDRAPYDVEDAEE